MPVKRVVPEVELTPPTPPSPHGVRPLHVLLIALLLHVVLNHVLHASTVVLSHLAH